MQIHSGDPALLVNKRFRKIIFGLASILLAILLFLLFKKESPGKFLVEQLTSPMVELSSDPKLAEKDMEYKIPLPEEYEKIIANNTPFETDAGYKIYIARDQGNYLLLYVIMESISGDKYKNNFFVHLNPKQGKMQNFDFKNNIKSYQHRGKVYFIAQQIVPAIDLKSIRTGQFYFSGKFMNVWNVTIKNETIQSIAKEIPKLAKGFPDAKKMTLQISEKDFHKIELKRLEALRQNILIAEDSDFVKAKVTFDGGAEQKAEIRLKGDWTDHLVHKYKWSFRVKMDGESTVAGMKKLSVHHPAARNYVYEWLFHKMLKREGLIGLRYDFIDVELHVRREDNSIDKKQLGLYACEESFDKRLIENNKRREGVIVAFDEDMMWADRAASMKIDRSQSFIDDHLQQLGPVRVFNEAKVFESPGLKKQFLEARDLLMAYKNKMLAASDVFDVKKLATFTAITNLVGAKHGLHSHNLRFYYNPVTGKLEPVGFDGGSGSKLVEIAHYFNTDDDYEYLKTFIGELERVSSAKYIKTIFETYDQEINECTELLGMEFNDATFNREVLLQNAQVIKKYINPSTALIGYLDFMDKENIYLKVHSKSIFPIELKGLETADGKFIAAPQGGPVILEPRKIGIEYKAEDQPPAKVVKFDLPASFDNLFVSKKSKKGGFQFAKDFYKIKMVYQTLGTHKKGTTSIVPFEEYNESVVDNIKRLRQGNLEEFEEILLVDDVAETVTFKPGRWELVSTLIVPPGYVLIAGEGVFLDLKKTANIISYSSVRFVGTASSPVRIHSRDGTGGGVMVFGGKQSSVLQHCVFNNLNNPARRNWSVSGAVNFNESKVVISNTTFKNNRCEDGLNLIRSEFTMDSVFFENTFSDAFDGDFVTGKMTNTEFIKPGNDAVDVSGSSIDLENVRITGAGDKGISVGEASSLTGKNIYIEGSEIAVVSKDLSDAKIVGLKIENCRLGFSAFRKKSEYGAAHINADEVVFSNVDVKYLIEEKSSLQLNKAMAETQREVIDQMYGEKYGKKSIR